MFLNVLPIHRHMSFSDLKFIATYLTSKILCVIFFHFEDTIQTMKTECHIHQILYELLILKLLLKIKLRRHKPNILHYEMKQSDEIFFKY